MLLRASLPDNAVLLPAQLESILLLRPTGSKEFVHGALCRSGSIRGYC